MDDNGYNDGSADKEQKRRKLVRREGEAREAEKDYDSNREIAAPVVSRTDVRRRRGAAMANIVHRLNNTGFSPRFQVEKIE